MAVCEIGWTENMWGILTLLCSKLVWRKLFVFHPIFFLNIELTQVIHDTGNGPKDRTAPIST